jgi:F-type H+-transporting ATPase subunit gamma
MANTREIQSRMKSIRDTMKITNAMYMISSTKVRRARKDLEETEPFFYTLQGMMERMIRHVPNIENRYFRQGDPTQVKSRGYLVVTADKGMAGAYNHNVLKLAEEEMKKNESTSLLVVGEVGRQYFRAQKINVNEEFPYTAQNPTMSRARDIAGKVLEMYETGQVEEVYMIYTDMINAAQTEAKMTRLLPLEKEDFHNMKVPVDVYQEEFFFEPSPEIVMDHIVPNYMSGYIYGALMESYCSEHNARMTAMQAANDSAQAILHELSIEYNRVRQAAITQEITEVISGAKAQKKKKKKKERSRV